MVREKEVLEVPRSSKVMIVGHENKDGVRIYGEDRVQVEGFFVLILVLVDAHRPEDVLKGTLSTTMR